MVKPSPVLWILASSLLLISIGSPQARGQETVLLPHEIEAKVLSRFPSVEAAAAAVAAASARLKRARYIGDPSFELSLGRGENRFDSSSDHEWAAAVELELPLPRQYRASLRVGRAGERVASAELLRVQAEARAQIRRLVVRLAAARQRVDLLRSQATTVEGSLTFTALRVELGEAREIERLRLQVELNRLQRRLDLARADYAALAGALRRLSGGALPEHFTVDLPLTADLPTSSEERPAAITLGESAAQRVKECIVAEAEERVGLERTRRMPSLITRLESATAFDSRSSSISVAFKVPLWNANRSAVVLAEAHHRIALAERELSRRRLESRLNAVQRRFEAARSSTQRFASVALPAARAAERIAELAYREGETSILDLLDARRSAQGAELEELEARLELHLLKLDLDLLTGRLDSPVNVRGLASQGPEGDPS